MVIILHNNTQLSVTVYTTNARTAWPDILFKLLYSVTVDYPAT